jgi:HAMP domain-containing protein
MKLLAKFNLILCLVLGVGLALAAVVSHHLAQEDARAEVVRQAQLMMADLSAARDYTTGRVKPLLEKQQEHLTSFLPETVPAFAATETFGLIRPSYPDYDYKEATLNPTNLRDRAADWEADVIRAFRNPANHGLKEIVDERDTPLGRSLYLARPIVARATCLPCHSTPDNAPASLIRHYGTTNGFGWQLNEVVGAQIVSVPMAVPVKMADKAFTTLLASLSLVFLATLVLLDLVLVLTVVRPLRSLAAMADQISMGKMDMPELPASGKDEISVLAGSFNRMRRSLERAIKMLEG